MKLTNKNSHTIKVPYIKLHQSLLMDSKAASQVHFSLQ